MGEDTLPLTEPAGNHDWIGFTFHIDRCPCGARLKWDRGWLYSFDNGRTYTRRARKCRGVA